MLNHQTENRSMESGETIDENERRRFVKFIASRFRKGKRKKTNHYGEAGEQVGLSGAL